MRNIFLIICSLLTAVAAIADGTTPYWEQPEVYAINKLPARATLLPYDNEAPGEFHRLYGPRGRKESDTTE